jgi:prepilin-type N-terminal cleavage/methylation domain-containing protein
MRATCSRATLNQPRGFTAVELIAVLVLVGVLAVVALPRLDGLLALRGGAWREQVQASLRQASVLAQGHRRLVCASIASQSVTLRIASVNPATSCNTALPGGDGDSRWAWDSNAPTTSASTATLYFQPDGRVTSDGAGSTTVNVTVTISGETTVSVNGQTSHVE